MSAKQFHVNSDKLFYVISRYFILFHNGNHIKIPNDIKIPNENNEKTKIQSSF